MIPTDWMDRVLALGTLLGVVALVAIVAANWPAFRGDPHVRAGAAFHAEATPEPAEEARPEVQRRAPAAAPARPKVQSTKAAQREEQPAAPPTLTIEAVAGESWLEVRAGDSEGEQLYYGTLAAGEEASFDRLPVWVRVGALSNLEIRLGASPLRDVPSAGGVAEFVASSEGVAAREP
jgi:hypothetical protein